MINKQLKEALIQRLDITYQAIWERAQKLKKIAPMSTEDAVYVVAHREGMRLDKYLDDDDMNRIRVLLQQITSTTQVSREKISRNAGVVPTKQYVVRIGKRTEYSDAILPRKKLVEASEMADVFPLIYVLENSIRELIDILMTKHYGNDWWDTQASPGLRRDVAIRLAGDKKDSWHQRRGARPIDYLDLKDLPRLVGNMEHIFVPDVISELEWFRQFVKEVYKSRCVVCHMNPLNKNNVDAVKVRFNQWQRLVEEKKDLILEQSS